VRILTNKKGRKYARTRALHIVRARAQRIADRLAIFGVNAKFCLLTKVYMVRSEKDYKLFTENAFFQIDFQVPFCILRDILLYTPRKWQIQWEHKTNK